MDDYDNRNECNSAVVAADILIDYLMPNWFHSVRQPLNIISTSAGFLQVLTLTDGYDPDLFNNKLQELQEQALKTEDLLNITRFFLSGTHLSIEKHSVYLNRMFELLGRDLVCWSIKNTVNIVNDFYSDNSLYVCLIIASIYKAFGSADNELKEAVTTVNLAANSSSSSCMEVTDSVWSLLLGQEEKYSIYTSLKTLISNCSELSFGIDYYNHRLIVSIFKK